MRERRAGGRSCVVLLLAVLAGSAPARAAEVAVRGRVLDDDGRPVRGALIELLPLRTHYDAALAAWRAEADPEPAVRATTDPEGRFALRAPDPGFWKTVVRAEGFVAAEYVLKPLLEDSTLADVRLARDQVLVVEIGRRLDGSGSAAPASNPARIEARVVGGRPAYEADGSWRAAPRVARAGALPAEVRLAHAVGESLEIAVSTPGGGTVRAAVSGGRARIALAAEPSPASALLVAQEDGAPLASALVLDAETAIVLGLTDDKGRADVAAAGEAQAPEVVVLAADGRAGRYAVSRQPARDGEPPTASVTVPNGSPLTGSVVADADGAPIVGAWVWTGVRRERLGASQPGLPANLPGELGLVVRSGPSGRFELRVATGVAVDATAVGHFQQPVLRGPSIAMRSPPVPSDPVVVRLAASRAIAGVVVNAADQPVTGALIVPYGPVQSHNRLRAVSDERGAFRLGGVGSRGAFKVVALATGYAPAIEQIDLREGVPREDVRIVLRGGRSVRGRVTDPDDRPVARARVMLAEARERSGGFFPQGFPGRSLRNSPPLLVATRADGSFSIDGVAPAHHYDVVIDAAGFAITAIPGVEIAAGEGAVDLGVLRVGAGVTVDGVVLEAAEDQGQETPIAGATVMAERGPAFQRIAQAPGPEPWSAWLSSAPTGFNTELETDGDGRFALHDLNPSETLNLRAIKDGYVTAVAPGVRGPTEKPVRLVLARGGAVRGRVVDENGEGVAAQVRASAASSSSVSDASAGEDGAFALESLARGSWRLEAIAPAYEPSEAAPVEVDLEPGEVEDGVRIVVREKEHGEIEGRVVDQDGAPLTSATVLLDQERGTNLGANGEFHLDHVARGPHRLTAMARGRTGTKTVEVREGVTTTVELTVRDGVEVSGRVVDQEGQAVGGANVTLVNVGPPLAGGGFRRLRSSPTDAEGGFRISDVEEGEYQLEAVLEESSRGRLPTSLRVDSSPIAGLEIVVERGATLRGALRGLDIDQLSQVTIQATLEAGATRWGFRPGRVIGAEYEVANLDAGAWRVVGEVRQHGLQAEGRVVLESGGEGRLDLDFEGGLTLSGTVSRRGEPAAGSSVQVGGLDVATQRNATADFEGRFALRGLAEGVYEVAASPGFGSRSAATWVRRIELQDDTELAIELGGSKVAGVVLDAESGDPIAGATVRMGRADADASGRQMGDSRTTGALGDFAYEEVPEGAFAIEATREGYASAGVSIEVRAESDAPPIAIELERSKGLVLHVAGALGFLPFIEVMVLDRGGLPVSSPFMVRPSRAEGVFEAPGVADGSWEILVGATRFGLAVVRLGVQVPGPPVEVMLPRAAEISIEIPELIGTTALANLEVLDATGRPFPLMQAGVYSPIWRVEAGRGQVEGLPPGQWTLRARTLDGRSWSGGVMTAPGATASARLQ